MLEAAGIAPAAIHGNKSQAQRERAIALFKSGEVAVLIATDIAARGIDIPGVSHVINYDLPEVPEQYVHRIGRTARAGADGIAIAFCAPDERGNLRDIERTTRQRIAVAPLPADFMASAEAFKRLKPAPKAEAQRSGRQATKADRRNDGQQRKNRNNGARHSHRAEGHAAHRSGTQDRSGQRPDEHSSQRRDGRSSFRPEMYRETPSERRPDGARPKRKFHGRPRRPGDPRRVQG